MHHSNSSDISPQSSKDLLLREAKRLHRAAQSDSPAESLPVLRRLLAAEAIPGTTLPAAFRARTQVQRKHVLRALALEAGYPSWEALVAALGDADLQALGQVLQAMRGTGVLKLWFSSMAQAQEYTRTHGGQAIAMGSQAVVRTMAEQLFAFCSNVAIAAWLGLGFAAALGQGPWRERLLFVAGRAVPLGLCLVYVLVLVGYWGTAPGGGFASLASVQLLFAAPGKVLGGWLHFLAFDLLVGHWMVQTVAQRNLARWPLLLFLPLAFLWGPMALLGFAAWLEVAQCWR